LQATFVLVLAIVPALRTGGTADAPENGRSAAVTFQKGRISIIAADVSMEDLVAKIGNRSGVAIELHDPESAKSKVSLVIKNRPLEEILDRLFRGLNVVLFYEHGRLSRAIVLSSLDAGEKSDPALIRGIHIPVVAEGPVDFEAALERNPAEGLQLIKKAMSGGETDAKLLAIQALYSVDDGAALDLLRSALSDADFDVRLSSLDALKERQSMEASRVLAGAMSDRDPMFRVRVLEVLGDRGDLEAIRKALSDPNAEVRELAAELLESLTEK